MQIELSSTVSNICVIDSNNCSKIRGVMSGPGILKGLEITLCLVELLIKTLRMAWSCTTDQGSFRCLKTVSDERLCGVV